MDKLLKTKEKQVLTLATIIGILTITVFVMVLIIGTKNTKIMELQRDLEICSLEFVDC